jgi:hypothetical protein
VRLVHAATVRSHVRPHVAPLPQPVCRPLIAARERRDSSRASRAGPSSSDDPHEQPPALAGPSPRFSRPWRSVDDAVAERRRALDALTGGRA